MIVNANAARLPLRSASVHCAVTSPPYWGLRDYGLPPLVWGGDPECLHDWGPEQRIHKGGPQHGDSSVLRLGGRSVVDAQTALRDSSAGAFCACGAWLGCLGLEPTPDLYVEHMVAVFREVRRVLRDDGTCWLNLGDSYAGSGMTGGLDSKEGSAKRVGRMFIRPQVPDTKNPRAGVPTFQPNRMPSADLKPKDLVGIPWRVAFALQADGWWLRADVIWSKPNPMPESVTDRPTKAHEYVFLLAKSERYFYDAEAVKEPSRGTWNAADMIDPPDAKTKDAAAVAQGLRTRGGNTIHRDEERTGRNRRTVWEISTQPYPEAHFATFPEALVEPCVMASTSEYGCCARCGAPWERVTEGGSGELRSPAGWDCAHIDPTGRIGRYSNTEYDGKRRAEAKAARDNGGDHDSPFPPKRTVSWAATCTCADPGPRVRPLVFDPFSGSGTVGQVCHRSGRRFVGLDLNPTYCRMAYRRTAQLGLI